MSRAYSDQRPDRLPSMPAPLPASLSMKTEAAALERRLIAAALERSEDNKAAAARLLEISERALWYKLKRYGM